MKKTITLVFSIILLFFNFQQVKSQDSKFLQLNGVDEFVEMYANSSLYSLTTGSIVCWVKFKSPINYGALFSISDSTKTSSNAPFALLSVRADGKIEFAVTDNGSDAKSVSLSAIGTISDNNWHHLAVVADNSGNIQVYLDGTTLTMNAGYCCGPLDYFLGDATGSNNMKIGALDRKGLDLFANIDMDEFALYSKALSANEVAQLKNNTLSNPNSSREIYYTFDQLEALVGTSGANDYADKSGNGNHGEFISKTITSVFNQSKSNFQIGVYPNPIAKGTTLTISGDLKSDYSVTLFDAQGKRVSIPTAQFQGNTFLIENLSIESGLYYLQVTADDNSSTTKQIVVIK